MKIITTVDFLKELIQGKREPYQCSGYPILNSHEVCDYELVIGRATYFYACPKCGFGEGGTLPEDVCEELRKMQEKQK